MPIARTVQHTARPNLTQVPLSDCSQFVQENVRSAQLDDLRAVAVREPAKLGLDVRTTAPASCSLPEAPASWGLVAPSNSHSSLGTKTQLAGCVLSMKAARGPVPRTDQWERAREADAGKLLS